MFLIKKLKIGLFLGAGSSMPYKKPTTKIFRDYLLNKESHDQIRYLTNLLKNSKFQDIEYILQSIKETKSFLHSYGGDFISSLLIQLKTNQNDRFYEFDINNFLTDITIVENYIKNKIFQYYRWDHNENKLLITIFDALMSLFNPENIINIFTTNYDNAIETYCGITKRYIAVDGFKHNINNRNYIWEGFFEPTKHPNMKDIFLYKLHGSLNWKKFQDGTILNTYEEAKPSDPRYIDSILIYPTLSPKNEELQEPYKTLISEFKKFTTTADVFIVIGYSFRDTLTEYFLDFIKRGNTKLIIISPTSMEDFTTQIHKKLTKDLTVNKIKLGFNFTNTEKNTSSVYCLKTTIGINTINNIIQQVNIIFKEENI